MSSPPMSQFSMRVAATDGDPHGPETVEQFALDLRQEFADLDRVAVEQVPAGVAPDGTRGLELLGVFAFIITAVQAGEALTKVVRAIQRVQERYARRKQPVRVAVDGVDLSQSDDVEAVVRRLAVTLRALPGQVPAGARAALVIANARYDDHALTRLRAPAHDADALARVLGDPRIGGFEVDQLVDADERTVRRRVAAFFADRNPDDLLLVHFSCHGIKDSRGRLHLATRDTDLATLGATAVPASFVHDVLDETRSRRVVLVLDCCYSGAFPRGSLARSGNDVAIAEEFGGGTGRVLLTASSATEYAFEGTELTAEGGQPSVFTRALIRGLETGDADLDTNGEIDIDELYDYAYRQMRAHTPGQAPMKWSFGVEGSLTVARSVRPAALPPSVLGDLASDRVVLRLEAVRELQHLLHGRPAVRAAATVALLQIRDGDDSARVRAAAAEALGGAGGDRPPAVSAAAAPAADRVEAAAEPATTPTTPRTRKPAAAAPHPGLAPEPVTAARPGPPPSRTTDGALVAAALLAVAAAFVYYLSLHVVGDETFGDTWFTEMIWLPVLAAAALLLVTRQARWAAVLAGALGGEWLTLPVAVHSTVREDLPEEWGVLLVSALIAIAAQTCAAVALWHRRTSLPPERTRTFAVAGAAAILGTAAALVGADQLMNLYNLDAAEGASLRTFAALACAAVLPAAVAARLSNRLAALVAAGWLLGGVQYAFRVSVGLALDGRDPELPGTAWVWGLVVAAALVVMAPAVAAGRGRRSAP